jgi:hypothetical protein
MWCNNGILIWIKIGIVYKKLLVIGNLRTTSHKTGFTLLHFCNRGGAYSQVIALISYSSLFRCPSVSCKIWLICLMLLSLVVHQSSCYLWTFWHIAPCSVRSGPMLEVLTASIISTINSSTYSPPWEPEISYESFVRCYCLCWPWREDCIM